MLFISRGPGTPELLRPAGAVLECSRVDQLLATEQLHRCVLTAQALRKQRQIPPPHVVRVRNRRLKSPVDYDVVMCGGTLGLFLALALQVGEKNGP